MTDTPPMSELICIFFDETDCIQIFLNLEVLKMLGRCTICDCSIVLRRILWSCNRKLCRKVLSVFKDAIFFQSRIECNQVMAIT